MTKAARKAGLPGIVGCLSLAFALALLGTSPVSGAGSADAPCEVGRSLLAELSAAGTLPALEAEAAAEPNGTGTLYRIEKDGAAPSTLFGTMHVSDPRVLALPEAAERAFGSASGIVVETLAVLDQRKLSALILQRGDLVSLPKGKTLGDYLGPLEKAEVARRLAEINIPFQSIETLQPWFFSIGLAAPACEVVRKRQGEEVLDVSLATRAKAQGKTVEGLESGLEQVEAMASMPIDLQVASLVTMLATRTRQPDLMATMVDLYLKGQIAMISALGDALMPQDAMSPDLARENSAFEERIIQRRNHVMAERLQPLLSKGGRFVAVGALHLPGREGLVELLRGAGYRVTAIDTRT